MAKKHWKMDFREYQSIRDKFIRWFPGTNTQTLMQVIDSYCLTNKFK